MEFVFKKSNDLESRKNLCQDLLSRNKGKYPVIVEKYSKSNAPDITKQKFLVPGEMTVTKFIELVKEKMTNLDPSQALFFLVAGKYSLMECLTMANVYDKFKDSEDKFLYISYQTEQVWG